MHTRDSQKLIFCLAVILFDILFNATPAYSEQFTSTTYKVLDPVMNSGGYGSSASFKLYGVISQVSVGTSTSLSFGDNAGFLAYPFASTPTVSATAGDTQVALSWTASDGALGWTPSDYAVGQSTTSGGPYTLTSVGNVLSSTRTGLSNGTTYYFVILVKDFYGNTIATSTQVSATPAGSGGSGPSGPSGPSGGSGPSGPTTSSDTNVILSGRAYPLSKVSFLKDGQLILTTIAGPDSNFNASLNNLSAGDYTFGVYGEDNNHVRSSMFTFPVYITTGVTTRIGGIFIAPTISVDKSEVKRGDNIVIFGQTAASSSVVINVNSEQEFILKKTADANGVYLLNFDSGDLEMGQHSTKSKSSVSGEISSYSKTVGFKVGTKNVAYAAQTCPAKADLNGDCKVNLVDFSIASYWYKRTLNDAAKTMDRQSLNNDGKIDLVDFSIMAYYWTG